MSSAICFNLDRSKVLSSGNELKIYLLFYRTPLHWATAMGHSECVRVLLEQGVMPNPFDQDGMAPVQYAKNAGHKRKYNKAWVGIHLPFANLL